MKQLIYVTDDEKNIRELIASFLRQEGYETKQFANGQSLLSACKELLPDMIILDIMMPGTDGFTICEKIREFSNLPIIFVSAKDSPYDRVRGINTGGDDYMVKPFLPLELVARVNALFRRSQMATANIENGESLVLHNLVMNMKERKAYIDEQELVVTPTEFSFLQYLLEHKDSAVSKKELIQEIWGFDYKSINTRVTDDLVTRLRKKLKQYNCQFEIETVWGFGYRIKGRNEV